MSAAVYLGDEVSAAGYRLAGARRAHAAARARRPRRWPGRARRRRWCCCRRAVAARIGEAALRAALSALAPLVLIVPDLHGEVPLPDLAARLRAQLGLEA